MSRGSGHERSAHGCARTKHKGILAARLHPCPVQTYHLVCPGVAGVWKPRVRSFPVPGPGAAWNHAHLDPPGALLLGQALCCLASSAVHGCPAPAHSQAKLSPCLDAGSGISVLSAARKCDVWRINACRLICLRPRSCQQTYPPRGSDSRVAMLVVAKGTVVSPSGGQPLTDCQNHRVLHSAHTSQATSTTG